MESWAGFGLCILRCVPSTPRGSASSLGQGCCECQMKTFTQISRLLLGKHPVGFSFLPLISLLENRTLDFISFVFSCVISQMEKKLFAFCLFLYLLWC